MAALEKLSNRWSCQGSCMWENPGINEQTKFQTYRRGELEPECYTAAVPKQQEYPRDNNHVGKDLEKGKSRDSLTSNCEGETSDGLSHIQWFSARLMAVQIVLHLMLLKR
ncbi:hypothetical protein AQUCO_01200011v1 [Aquilegia coerulea]|uniref:Uncharacterized protein n=1 Tax=Aquilegia coerulea TaxID=218851 RepID=A0A2G5E431_AQUCA|nr:hypothetical protein AQUCO_01200011v1 [Aquilegia coerulea]